MKKHNRILSAVLAVVMMIPLLVIPAFADEDIDINPVAPTLRSASVNFKINTPAGVSVTHNSLTIGNFDDVKVFYTDDGTDPEIRSEAGVAVSASPATKELIGVKYPGWGGNLAVEYKIINVTYGKTYKAVVTSVSGVNKSAVGSYDHVPIAPTTSYDSGAWKTGFLTHLILDLQDNTTIYYTMGLAPVTDGEVTAENLAQIAEPTSASNVYNATTGIPLMDGRTETTAVVVKAYAHSGGFDGPVATYYYYNDDNITMLTEARGKSEAEQIEIIDQVIESMTLYELTQMTGGASTRHDTLNTGAEGRTWGIPRLGIPQNMLSDGPAGLRHKKLSTAFMSWAGISSTWDVEAYEAVGRSVAEEAIYYGIDIVLAPGLNIQRNPLGGRNFEYMSEDPLVSGEAAAGYTRGIQSGGVGVSAKHFVANEQETNRNSGNSVVSERALREIYLAPFERVVQDRPWTIMTSYNQLNGVQTANDYWLLEEVARGEWGFDGYFMTDWGGVQTGPLAIEAGNDMSQSGNAGAAIRAWIEEDGIDEEERDRRLERTKDAVRNILIGVVKTPSFIGTYDDLNTAIVNSRSDDFYTNPNSPYEQSKQVNYDVAAGGIVLMKNDNVLPLKGNTSFALVSSGIARTASTAGATWSDPGNAAVHDLIIMGGGSGHVYFEDAITVKEGLERIDGYSVPYAAVDADIASDAAAEAAIAVGAADAGIMIFSRTATEGSDNAISTYDLSDDEKVVLEAFGSAFKEAGKPFIAIINSGSAINVTEMNENADAILDVWLSGTQGAEALSDIIKGIVNPSGKLAQGFPVNYTDSPSVIMGNPDRDPVNSWGTNPVFYDEGVFVGYRYFDTFGGRDRVAYPFGHGLSYTTFEYSDLTLSSDVFLETDESITATVTVKNNGEVAGREVVQLYLGADSYKEEGRPYKDLRNFAKTDLLEPGESQTVEFEISMRDLQYYDDGEDPMGLVLEGTAGRSGTNGESNVEYGKGRGWTVEEGTKFNVIVGTTSDDTVLAVSGVTESFYYATAPESYSLSHDYLQIIVGEEEEFEVNMGSEAVYAEVISGDETIATVTPSELDESGTVKVTGVAKGTADITVNFYAPKTDDDAEPENALLVEQRLFAENEESVQSNEESGSNPSDTNEDADEDNNADEDNDTEKDNDADENTNEDMGADDLDNATDNESQELNDQRHYNLTTSQTGEIDPNAEDPEEDAELKKEDVADSDESAAAPAAADISQYRLLGSEKLVVDVRDQDEIEMVTVTFIDRADEITVEVRKGERISTDDWPIPTRSGYTFDGWFGENGEEYTVQRTFEANITLTAKWTQIPVTTPGGGSSRGGGNGGQSGGSTPSASNFAVIGATVATTSANVGSNGAVNQATITSEATTALAGVAEGGTATVKTRNAKIISQATIKALADAANAASKNLILHADTTSGSAVQGRLYVNPADINQDLQLGVYTEDAQVATLKVMFENWFSNKLAVVKFDQQGSFGSRLQVAVKVDLSGMDTSNLKFYSYDQTTNSYRAIENPAYFVDTNGYLHFYTQQAGNIIISVGELIRK